MIFIINKTNEKAAVEVKNNEDNAILSLNLSGEDKSLLLSEDILITDNADIMEAMTKRFPTSKANLNNLINTHDFFIPMASIGFVFNELIDRKREEYEKDGSKYEDCGDLGYKPVKMVAIPKDTSARSEFQKFVPKNIIIVATSIDDNYECEVLDNRNALASSCVETNGYRLFYFVIKWPNWSNLTYPAAIKIEKVDGTDIQYLKLTSTSNGKYTNNDLVVMTDHEASDFISEYENRQAEQMRKKALGRNRNDAQNGHRQNYNNPNPKNGKNDGFDGGNRNGKTNNNNNNFRNNSNNRGGNRKPNGSGNRKGGRR